MKKCKQILAISLCILMLVGIMPLGALATQSRYYNFSNNYSHSDDPGTYVANIAYAQLGRSGSSLGYSENWCADFATDCAALAGQSNAAPKDGYCPTLKTKLIDAGGYETRSPKVGDFVFVDWNGNGGYNHVEIVYSVSGSSFVTIGGNRGNNDLYAATVKTQSWNSAYHSWITNIIRPNYDGSSSGGTTTGWDFNKPSTYPSYPGLLKVGSSGQTVSFVQTSLNWLGFDCGSVDGQYGNATKSAVWAFQEHYGLDADGIVGEQTWSKIIDCVGINDIGSGFYAYIIQYEDWKHIENTGSNIQIAANGNDIYDPKQIWYFERTEYGTYKITSAYDGNAVDLHNYQTENGTNIQPWTSHGDICQQWIVFYNNNGKSYGLRSCCGNTIMDCNNGETSEGTNIQIWERNDTNAQHFAIYRLSNDGRTYSKPNRPDASTISVKTLGNAGKETTLSWSASPEKNNYDYRTYDLKIGHGTSDSVEWDESLTKRDLTSTTYSIKLPAGTYTAQVVSVNEKFPGWLTYGNKITFTVEEMTHVHSYTSTVTKTATCKETGIKTFTCSCGSSYTETIAKNTSNHVGGTTVKNATTATCTTTGYTGDTYCNGCNAKLSAGKTVDKTAHADKNNDGYCDNCKTELTSHEPTNPTPDAPTDTSCSCNCHKGGFSGLIWKIVNFFHKIFGMNQYKECACGKSHW